MHRTTQILTQSKNSDNELKQTVFPLKMPDCCLNLLFLPFARTSPGGGWFSGWSRERELTIGRCAETPTGAEAVDQSEVVSEGRGTCCNELNVWDACSVSPPAGTLQFAVGLVCWPGEVVAHDGLFLPPTPQVTGHRGRRTPPPPTTRSCGEMPPAESLPPAPPPPPPQAQRRTTGYVTWWTLHSSWPWDKRPKDPVVMPTYNAHTCSITCKSVTPPPPPQSPHEDQ